RLLLVRATATRLSADRPRPRRRRSQPWTHGGMPASQPPLPSTDEDRLRAISDAEPAVRLVQMAPDGAGRDPELSGDVLVELAFGQPADGGELVGRQWTRVERSRLVLSADREVVHDLAQRVGAQPQALGGAQHLIGVDGLALVVASELVGELHHGRSPFRPRGVVLLHRLGQTVREAPAAQQHATERRVIHAELEALRAGTFL